MQPRADELIQRYLDGIAEPGELAELESLLISQPEVAAALANAARMDSALHQHFAENREIEAAYSHAGIVHRAPPTDWSGSGRKFAIAAALLIAVTGLIYVAATSIPDPVPSATSEYARIEQGTVLVNGVPNGRVAAGSELLVLDQPAVFALDGGSRVELAPESLAEFRGEPYGKKFAVVLREGAGSFDVQRGGEFAVETPLGSVTTFMKSAFTVKLIINDGGLDLMKRYFLALAVTVSAGTVQVDFDGNSYRLEAGASRTFAADEPKSRRDGDKPRETPKADPNSPDRRPDASGTFVSHDAERGTVIINVGERAKQPTTFLVAKDATVLIEGKKAKLSDLKEGTPVSVFVNEDKSTIVSLRAEGRTSRTLILRVDTKARTIIRPADGGRELATPVSQNVVVIINGEEAKLEDIPANSAVVIRMSVDQQTVSYIQVTKQRGGAEPRREGDRPKEGEKPRIAPKDGEKPRVGPKDGEKPREGPKDGEKPRVGPKDGEKPRESDKPRRPDGE